MLEITVEREGGCYNLSISNLVRLTPGMDAILSHDEFLLSATEAKMLYARLRWILYGDRVPSDTKVGLYNDQGELI